MAMRAVLSDFRAGRVCRTDICDAHPELMRAARNVGEVCAEPCPVCSASRLVLVAYAFSSDLKRDNGRVWPRHDLAGLVKLRDARLYTVEVCLECSWNHLRTAVLCGSDGSRGREISN